MTSESPWPPPFSRQLPPYTRAVERYRRTWAEGGRASQRRKARVHALDGWLNSHGPYWNARGFRRGAKLTRLVARSTTTYYSISLQPPHSSDKTTLTVSVVLPHASRPHPVTLPQTADSIYMLWQGDLLAPLHGLSRDQKSKLDQVKVRIKTPTPRVVDVKAPEGFAIHQQQGSATITFTSRGTVADLDEQVRFPGLGCCYPRHATA